MRIAYLVNQYPKVSHTFIRRELQALEAQGFDVLRCSVRRVAEPLTDPADTREAELTRVVLDGGPEGLALAMARVAAKRPAAFWTRTTGPFRRRNPPVRIGIPLWFHLSLDAVWVLNGVVYIVLLFATGHWLRIVPTSWEVVPNALSAALQYASLDWPTENGWVNYNSLQPL